MKQFYVLEKEKLEDYGFQKNENGDYLYSSHRAVCVWVNHDSGRLMFQSASKECVATICEMYKKGVLAIFDDEVEETYNMKVTEEEMKAVFEMRKKRYEAKI